MPEDNKRISELPGITPQAVVALTRDGLVTFSDLLAADFDRVAYLTEDYNEAARLVREAAKEVPGSLKKSRSGGDGPGVSTPVMRSPLRSKEHGAAAPAEAPVSASPPPRPLKIKETPAKAPHAPGAAPKEKSDMKEPKLGEAMGAALRGLSLGADEVGVQGRAVLRRRLAVACLLLEHGADEAEMAAALILEGAEEGALPVEEIATRFGKPVEKLIEECASLRAVPLLPSGKLPRYYTDMAKSASGAARRICAAYLLESDRRGQAEWHARMLVQGLTSGEPEELVTLAQRTVSPGNREAA